MKQPTAIIFLIIIQNLHSTLVQPVNKGINVKQKKIFSSDSSRRSKPLRPTKQIVFLPEIIKSYCPVCKGSNEMECNKCLIRCKECQEILRRQNPAPQNLTTNLRNHQMNPTIKPIPKSNQTLSIQQPIQKSKKLSSFLKYVTKQELEIFYNNRIKTLIQMDSYAWVQPVKNSQFFSGLYKVINQISQVFLKKYEMTFVIFRKFKTFFDCLHRLQAGSKQIKSQENGVFINYSLFELTSYTNFLQIVNTIRVYTFELCFNLAKNKDDYFLCKMNFYFSFHFLQKQLNYLVVVERKQIKQQNPVLENHQINLKKKVSYYQLVDVYVEEYLNTKKSKLIKIKYSKLAQLFEKFCKFLLANLKNWMKEEKFITFLYRFMVNFEILIRKTESREFEFNKRYYRFDPESLEKLNTSIKNLEEFTEENQILFSMIILDYLTLFQNQLQKINRGNNYSEDYYLQDDFSREKVDLNKKIKTTDLTKSIRVLIDKYKSSFLIIKYYNFQILCEQLNIQVINSDLKNFWYEYLVTFDSFLKDIHPESGNDYSKFIMNVEDLKKLESILEKIIILLQNQNLTSKYSTLIWQITTLLEESRKYSNVHSKVSKSNRRPAQVSGDQTALDEVPMNNSSFPLLLNVEEKIINIGTKKSSKQLFQLQKKELIDDVENILFDEKFKNLKYPRFKEYVEEILIIYKYLKDPIMQETIYIVEEWIIELFDLFDDPEDKHPGDFELDEKKIFLMIPTLQQLQQKQLPKELKSFIDLLIIEIQIIIKNIEGKKDSQTGEKNRQQKVSSQPTSVKGDFGNDIDFPELPEEKTQEVNQFIENQELKKILPKNIGNQLTSDPVEYLDKQDSTPEISDEEHLNGKNLRNLYLIEILECSECLQDELMKKIFDLEE